MGIGSMKSEAGGMFSADGEFVEFTHPVLLEGPVEVSSEQYHVKYMLQQWLDWNEKRD